MGRDFGAGECKEVTVVLRADGTGGMPGVVWMDDALHASVFAGGRTLEDTYKVEQYPLIWVAEYRVLICRYVEGCYGGS